MPATYKLSYFGARARAELARLVFEAAGKTYENETFTFEEWPAFKPKMPTGQVPVLEIDGKQLSQSLAIARYLAREFGMAGKDSMEQALVDQVVDTAADGFTEYVKLFFEKDETKKAELKKKIADEVTPKFAKLFTMFLERSGGKKGFFIGDCLTLADLAVHELFTDFLMQNADALEPFPKLAANRLLVEQNENIKRYLDKRPKSDI